MEMKELPVDQVSPNPLQPREVFDKEKLKELAATIADVGVLQPILVRPKDGRYEIIAGERRWKATQIAGLKTIPALIKELPDSQVMVESLIENVHRSNLKPMEQAKAILEVFKASNSLPAPAVINDKLPQKITSIAEKRAGRYANNKLTEEEIILDDIIKRIGLAYRVVSNSLKLLSLPDSIQIGATEKRVSKEHLVSISTIETKEDQQQVFDVIVEKELSSRETAALTKVVKSAPEPVKRAVLDATVPVEVAQTIIDTKLVDEDQEALVDIAVKKNLTEEGISLVAGLVSISPEPVKRAILDTKLDTKTARTITLAFDGLPEDATEQVTKEVIEMVDNNRTEAYIGEHIYKRKDQAERLADPMYIEPKEERISRHEMHANGIITICKTVMDIHSSFIKAMPQIHKERSISAIMEAHKRLGFYLQLLHKNGLLSDEEIDKHKADCAMALTEGITIPDVETVNVGDEFIDTEYTEV